MNFVLPCSVVQSCGMAVHETQVRAAQGISWQCAARHGRAVWGSAIHNTLHCKAGRCEAMQWQGTTRHGGASRGTALHSRARFGMSRYGAALQCGTMWRSTARQVRRRWRAEAPTCQICFPHNSLSFVALAAAICGIVVSAMSFGFMDGVCHFAHWSIVNFSTH